MLTVVLENTEEAIGFINFDIDEVINEAELSYIFDFEYWNRGYCTEACQKIMEVGFNDLDIYRIYADTISGNVNSIRVLEKIGMKKLDRKNEPVFVETINEYRDFIDYSILKQDYN